MNPFKSIIFEIVTHILDKRTPSLEKEFKGLASYAQTPP